MNIASRKIYGIVGFIGSGKDTLADCFVSVHNFRRESFASSLKDAVSVVFNWDRELLEGKTAESRKWRETVDTWWSNRLQIPNLTPRWVLQFWGTNVLRNHFHNDIWIASLENKLMSSTENIVISDCRFSNEIAMIKQAGGTIIWIRRGDLPTWYYDALSATNQSPDLTAIQELSRLNIHPSEWEWIGSKPDIIVDNNGTINELHNAVNSLIIRN